MQAWDGGKEGKGMKGRMEEDGSVGGWEGRPFCKERES